MRAIATSLCLAVCALLLIAAACAPGETPDEAAVAPDAEASAPSGPLLQILGTAQDGGLPHAACSCARCERARSDPAQRRLVASAGLVIPADGKRYLVDATPDIREQLHALAESAAAATGAVNESRVDRRPVDGVLLTHAHIGHYLGLAFFGFEAAHTRQVPTFCTPSMADYLATNGPWDQLVRLENITLERVEHEQVVQLHDQLTVAVIPVPHRDEYADTVGFLFSGPQRSLLYVPDTDGWQHWEPPLPEQLVGVDVAILDGTFFSLDELPGREVASIGHPLIEQTMDLLQPLVDDGRLEVWFTHLNHSNPALDTEGEAAAAIRERGFGIASDGQQFPL